MLRHFEYLILVKPSTMEEIKRTTAFGTWRFAKEYLQAAKIIEKTVNFNLEIAAPRYYLLGHGIELALKAFLLAKNVPPKELQSKKMAHDLEKALVSAEKLGLSELVALSPDERESIVLLNKTYEPKEHEYFITTGGIVLPPTSVLFAVLNKVLSAIRTVCHEATQEKEGAQ